MGLDMYLNQVTHLAKTDYYDHLEGRERNASDQAEHDMAGAVIDVIGVTPYDGDLTFVEVHTTIMYWRKANAIHGWFVDNAQEGVDDCGHYTVPFDTLIELAALTDDVITHRNPGLLEPRAGFFFGDAKVDSWYWDELERTHTALAGIVDRHNNEQRGRYEYHSSW